MDPRKVLALILLFVGGCAEGPGPIELLGPPSPIQGQVAGSVRTDTGPVDGATISLSPGPVTTVSDAAGLYAFTGVVPGSYLLRATAAGFLEASRDVSVLAGRSAGGDISMVRAVVTGALAGRVLDGSIGVPGARVALDGTGIFALTADDGTFLFTGVSPGFYGLTVSRPGFLTAVASARVGPNQLTRLDVSMPRRNDGSISGRITDGLRGIASCTRIGVVALFTGTGSGQQFVPDPDACARARGIASVDDRFVFDGLPTGTYILQASVNGFRSGTKTIQVVGGLENNGDVVLTLDGRSSAVTGTVFDDRQLVLPGARIELSAGTTRATTSSGADGRYVLRGLPPGSASATITASAFLPAAFALTLTAGNTADGSVILRR